MSEHACRKQEVGSVGDMKWQLLPPGDRIVTTLVCTVRGLIIQLVYSLHINRLGSCS